MKKLFFLLLTILLLMPLTQALYYSTSGAEKTVTFISKYGSRSMDSQTLDYYEKIKQNYNVYIVKDLSVSGNSQDWKTALDDSDLIFLISLSDEVLNETRDDFCKNLATTLNKSVGIAFAGNSVMSKDDFYGCIYTSHFNFAELWKNSELLSNKVTITKLHEMTGDYQKGDYNLGENKTIYPVISPNNGDTLAIVNGDPDGLGARPAADYPLFVLWRGLRYNAVSWGITTSKLSGCSNCLDWKLLYQFLDWVSDKDNMGFDVDTDKTEYYSSDRISVYATSDVNMNDVSGSIIYPGGQVYELMFTGSGKSWSSVYLIQDEDPPGKYIISVTADTLEVTKKIQVKVMKIDVSIDNSTEKVRIDVELTNKYDQRLEDSEIYISVAKPSGLPNAYSFNGSSVSMIYNVTESGNHTVYITGKDSNDRIESVTKSFYFKLKPNITFTPTNITETVNEAGNMTKSVYVMNQGEETLLNIVVKAYGGISDWIDLNITPFSLTPDNYTIVSFDINIPEATEGEHTGFLNFSTDRGYNTLPISITLHYLGELGISPISQSEWLTVDKTKEIEFELSNSGKGSLEIKSVTPSLEIEEWVHISNQPKLIPPRGKGQLTILVSTEGVSIGQTLQTISGNLEITTDLGVHYQKPSITLKILSDLSEEADAYYPEIVELERDIIELKGEGADVSNLEREIQKIREKIDNMKEVYNNGQLETSYEMFTSIQEDIDILKTSVQARKNELKQQKSRNIRILVLLVVGTIVIVVGFIVYKNIRTKTEYGWLYTKWRRR